MDTLSRDSNNSGSILPLVGVIAGALALILAIAALVQISKLNKTVAAQGDEVAKIAGIDSEVKSASATASAAAADGKALRAGLQNTFDSVGNEIGAVKARVATLEAAQKAHVAAPGGKGGKGGGVVTGTVDADGNYAVAPGDTLSKIAKKFATRVDALEAENPGLDPAKLKVGQKIKIPKK
jgi:LysM repeat protein